MNTDVIEAIEKSRQTAQKLLNDLYAAKAMVSRCGETGDVYQDALDDISAYRRDAEHLEVRLYRMLNRIKKLTER